MDFLGANTTTMLTRLLMDVVVTFIIVRLIYYPLKKDKDYVFTFTVFNVLIFFICYFMSTMTLSMGFAFGLFALFAILRYRTTTIPIKEMTYLFTVIVIAVINSLSIAEISLAEIILANIAIVLLLFLLERVFFRIRQGYKVITYEKIDLIKADRSGELLQDLQERTGLDITEFEVDSINFLTDSAKVKIFFNRQDPGISRVVGDND